MLDYLHIGASRAGSTWLYTTFVGHHPNIISPSGRKQTFFWNRANHEAWRKRFRPKTRPTPERTFEWYRDLYQNRPNRILCDFTDGNSWISLGQIQAIKQAYPNVKISYFVRNPITTIWSHVVKHDKLVSPDAPLKTIQAVLTDPAYVHNTHYGENIQNWCSVFPKQIKIFLFRDVINHPVVVLDQLSRFLGIDEQIWYRINTSCLSQPVNVGTQRAPIRPDVLEWLVDYYKNDLEFIQNYFGTDLSVWSKGKE